MTKETQMAIERDPTLRELDRVCREIPLPVNFELTHMGGLDDKTVRISYYFSSTTPYPDAQVFWIDYFGKNSWNRMKEKEQTFPHQEMRFANAEYEVSIFYGGMGERAQYAINCKKK